MADLGAVTLSGTAAGLAAQNVPIPVVFYEHQKVFTGVPTTGQIWPRSRTQVIDATPPERQTVSFATGNLASQDVALGSVNLGKSFHLIDITTTAPARVRLYTTTAARTADLPRSRGTNPDSTIDHGVILDFASAPTLLSADLSPVVIGHDGETYPDGLIPYAVGNLDPVNAANIQVVITYLPLAEWEE